MTGLQRLFALESKVNLIENDVSENKNLTLFYEDVSENTILN